MFESFHFRFGWRWEKKQFLAWRSAIPSSNPVALDVEELGNVELSPKRFGADLPLSAPFRGGICQYLGKYYQVYTQSVTQSCAWEGVSLQMDLRFGFTGILSRRCAPRDQPSLATALRTLGHALAPRQEIEI